MEEIEKLKKQIEEMEISITNRQGIINSEMSIIEIERNVLNAYELKLSFLKELHQVNNN